MSGFGRLGPLKDMDEFRPLRAREPDSLCSRARRGVKGVAIIFGERKPLLDPEGQVRIGHEVTSECDQIGTSRGDDILGGVGFKSTRRDDRAFEYPS